MSNLDKLKKKAAEFEQKKQFDRALEVYLQIIGQTETQDDRDVTIFNRVGDLYLRLNKTDQAVNYYEQAVDLYTDGGYLNNAIALCNKILRHAPARHQIYYKLGKISAKKGFNSDAKKNFLEYADRMHRAGKDGDAFKALAEFADLCPGQDDIRLMLADQLARAGKTAEAVEQLQILHESLDAGGRAPEAEATVQRMQALDPSVEPRRSNSPREKESGGLVFLDVGGSPVKPRPKISGFQTTAYNPTPARPSTPPHVQPSPEFERLSDLEPTSTPDIEFPSLEIESASSVADIEPAFDLNVEDVDVSPLEGLESLADLGSFVIAPEPNDIAEPPLEGLIPSEIGQPIQDENPLAGLSVLEDDRFFIHDTNPLEGLRGAPEAEFPPQTPAEDFPDIEPLELEVEEAEPDEPEEAEPEPVEEPVRPSRPRLVEPVRPTRPKPKVEPARGKTPSKTERSNTPSRGERPKTRKAGTGETREPQSRPLNPFQRQRPKLKPSEPSPKSTPRLATPSEEAPGAGTPRENPPRRTGDDNFVDLANWLREDSGPRSTRMIAEEDRTFGEDEQADFTDMLEKFKAGIAANVDEEDFDSHYDLGVAYKEMGLIDEAVAEFQKALRGATQRIRAYEALGQCFIERKEYDVAITVLSRALREPGMEDEGLIGVLYLLGFASEEGRKPRDAAAYYQRVFAIDIDFRDVSKRLKQMGKAASK